MRSNGTAMTGWCSPGRSTSYFGECYGKLPYRSLSFRHETLPSEWHQPVAVVNYPGEEVPYTRVTEYKHLTGQQAPQTSITYRISVRRGRSLLSDPAAGERGLVQAVRSAGARETPGVLFVGRLATYRYYNMDQVVGQALATYRRLAARTAAAADDATILVGQAAE